MKNIKSIKKEIRKLIKGKEKGYFFDINDPYREYEKLVTSDPTNIEKTQRRLKDTILLASLFREKKKLQASKKNNINLKFKPSLFWDAIYKIQKEKDRSSSQHYYNIPPFIVNENTVHILNYIREDTPISIKNINKETLKILIDFTINNPYRSRIPKKITKIFYTYRESIINIIKEDLEYYAKNDIESQKAGEKTTAAIEMIYSHIIKYKKNKECILSTSFLNKKTLTAIPLHMAASIAERSFILHKEDVIQLLFYLIKENKKQNPYKLEQYIRNVIDTIQRRKDLSLLETAKRITQIRVAERMLSLLSDLPPTLQVYEDFKQAAYHLQIIMALQNKNVTRLITKKTEKIIETLLILKDYIEKHPHQLDVVLFKIIKNIVNQNHIEKDVTAEKIKYIASSKHSVFTNRSARLYDIIYIAESITEHGMDDIVKDITKEIINESKKEEKNLETNIETLTLIQQTLSNNNLLQKGA